jgi:hypothetical protein
MALSLNPRTDNDPHVVDGKISLYEQRINANALSIAAEENLDIRQALLPYPSPGNMEVLATTFGLKRKVSDTSLSELLLYQIIWCKLASDVLRARLSCR